jgi:hypothetical protein
VSASLRKNGVKSAYVTTSRPIGGSWGAPIGAYTLTVVYSSGESSWTVPAADHTWSGVLLDAAQCLAGATVATTEFPPGPWTPYVIVGGCALGAAFPAGSTSARQP